MFYENFTLLGSGSLALREHVDLEANTFQELTVCCSTGLEGTPTQTKVLGLYNYFLMGSVTRWVFVIFVYIQEDRKGRQELT